MKLIDKIKQMSAETLAAYLVYGYGDLLTASASKDKWQWVQTIAEKLNEDEGEPESAAVELVIDNDPLPEEYTLCHAQEHKLIADGLRELNKNFEAQDKLASLRAKEIIAIRNEQRKLNERYDVLERAIVALTKNA
jgi:hypothetical protein